MITAHFVSDTAQCCMGLYSDIEMIQCYPQILSARLQWVLSSQQ